MLQSPERYVASASSTTSRVPPETWNALKGFSSALLVNQGPRAGIGDAVVASLVRG